QGHRVVDREVGVHLESEFMDSVLAAIFRRVTPVRNDFFLPLPRQSFGVLLRPAVGNPGRRRVGRRTTRTAGETDDYAHIQFLCQQYSLAEGFGIARRYGRVGVNRISVTAKRRNTNVVIVEFLFPGPRLWLTSDPGERRRTRGRKPRGECCEPCPEAVLPRNPVYLPAAMYSHLRDWGSLRRQSFHRLRQETFFGWLKDD